MLVKVLRVGVDGTDKEINAAEYGDGPDGDDFLITGHESFGRVIEVGAERAEPHRARRAYVVATVRRPGASIYDPIGLQDMTTDDVYFERGINQRHGYLTEYYVDDHRVRRAAARTVCSEIGVLLEPLTVAEKGINQAFEIQRRLKVWQPRRAAVLGSGHRRPARRAGAAPARHRGHLPRAAGGALPQQRPDRGARRARYVSSPERDARSRTARPSTGRSTLIFEATGFSPLVFEAAQVLGKNGVLVLVSVTGGDRTRRGARSDRSTRAFVLGNKVMVGTRQRLARRLRPRPSTTS